jgi:CRP-like cAMP-binding protein
MAMSDRLLEILRGHPFVAEFRPEHVAKLAGLARQVHFDAGQVIFREGDDYSVLYLLGEGMVALELETPGRVLRVQTLHAGDVFDWSALLPHAGKHFQARALDAVTALAFEGEELLAAFKDDPALGMAFMLKLLGVVSERLGASRVQLVDMYATEARLSGT